jgi:hypothetical protein
MKVVRRDAGVDDEEWKEGISVSQFGGEVGEV